MKSKIPPEEERAAHATRMALPFDADLLDRLLDEAGIDALIVSSKHNIQYLLGGYRFFFFAYMDAIGISRYLPLLIYVKGRPDLAAYVGNPMESYERELGRFWMATFHPQAWGTLDAVATAVGHIKGLPSRIRTIGLETSFIPGDAYAALRDALPAYEFVDALFPLERLRAQKTQAELDVLRQASERVVDAMLAVIARHGPGSTKREIAEALRLEEVKRGLVFEYCLISAATSFNRAPSDQKIAPGDIVSMDSGGNYQGYIGDLCRMAIAGQPGSELLDLLAQIENVQQEARKPIRSGVPGGDIFAAVSPLLQRSAHRGYTSFMAHGMGIVSHEAPRLTGSGPVPYPGYDADRPLKPGMVISIETTMKHPTRGFIKLEDTVAVTEDGCEVFADRARGWNRLGA